MKQLLLIDPDPAMRLLTAKALESAGFKVAAVAGAEGAIKACEDNRPEIIVLELQLRAHSGVEFLHELLSYPEWQGIPVVLYTMVPENDLRDFKDSFKTLNIVKHAYKPETSLKKLAEIITDTTTVSA